MVFANNIHEILEKEFVRPPLNHFAWYFRFTDKRQYRNSLLPCIFVFTACPTLAMREFRSVKACDDQHEIVRLLDQGFDSFPSPLVQRAQVFHPHWYVSDLQYLPRHLPTRLLQIAKRGADK